MNEFPGKRSDESECGLLVNAVAWLFKQPWPGSSHWSKHGSGLSSNFMDDTWIDLHCGCIRAWMHAYL